MIHKACMPVYMNSGKIVAGRDGTGGRETSKVLQEVLADLKSLTIAKCEKILSEKYVQETAGTGGDSITSTLVDYPINPFYLPS